MNDQSDQSANPAIAQLGNPSLRAEAEPIHDLRDERVQALIDQLLTTVQQANGVGLAATQLSEPYRVLVIASHPSPRYPHAPEMAPIALINPRLVAHSTETVTDWEGCLSVPGIRGLVPRYEWVTVEYTDREGKLQHQELTGFVARIFQHEYDHLHGLVFLDRVQDTHQLMTEAEYQRQIINSCAA
ncbi:peptide deformylase [Trichothermofontia sp.]